MSTAPQNEVSFYSDDSGVRVTSARFIVGNTTYAMSNITSVKKSVEDPDPRLPWFCIRIGVLCVLFGFHGSGGLVGLVIITIIIGSLLVEGTETRIRNQNS
jgi:hypothetical protein